MNARLPALSQSSQEPSRSTNFPSNTSSNPSDTTSSFWSKYEQLRRQRLVSNSDSTCFYPKSTPGDTPRLSTNLSSQSLISSLSSPVRIKKRYVPRKGLPKLPPIRRNAIVSIRVHLRVIAHLAIWFHRKILSQQAKILLDILSPYLTQFSFIEAELDPGELGFNKAHFKCNKDFIVLDQKAQHVFYKTPILRTPEDVQYISMRLRQLRTFANYPTIVQGKLAKCVIYQKYSAKRLILRQDHKPAGFYIILKGSVLSFRIINDEKRHAVPLEMLDQGGTFGDREMLVNARRQSNWVSMTDLEVLWITVQDYAQIYHSEEVGRILVDNADEDEEDADATVAPNETHHFIRQLPHFQGWPFAVLAKAPHLHSYRIFNRNDIIEASTHKSTKVYFVITGSLSVVKTLPLPQVTDSKDRRCHGGTRRGLLNPKMARKLGVYNKNVAGVYRRLTMAYNLQLEDSVSKKLLPLPLQIARMIKGETIYGTMLSGTDLESNKQSSIKQKKPTRDFSKLTKLSEDSGDHIVSNVPSARATPEERKQVVLRRISRQVAVYQGFLLANELRQSIREERPSNVSIPDHFLAGALLKQIDEQINHSSGENTPSDRSRRGSLMPPTYSPKGVRKGSENLLVTSLLNRSISLRQSMPMTTESNATSHSNSPVNGDDLEARLRSALKSQNTLVAGDDDDGDDGDCDAKDGIISPLLVRQETPVWLTKTGKHLAESRRPFDPTKIEDDFEDRALTPGLEDFRFEDHSVTILIERIEPGSFFGMAEVYYKHQPDCVITTQTGAEVFEIDREFYHKYAPRLLRVKLAQELVNGYPNDRELMNSLQHYVDWKKHTKTVFIDQLRRTKSQKNNNSL